jgi:hypothetical protein
MGRLRRGVGAIALGAAVGRGRGDVDDRAATPADHRRSDGLDPEKNGGRVDALDQIPIRKLYLGERTDADDARIVHQDVQTAVLLLDRGDDLRPGSLICDVEMDVTDGKALATQPPGFKPTGGGGTDLAGAPGHPVRRLRRQNGARSSPDRSPRPSLTRFAGWSSPDGSRLAGRHDSNGPNPAPRHQHGITSNAGSAQAAPCGSTSADQVVKMSSGRNAETRKLGTSTSWLTLRSTATLQMAYAC